MEFVFSKLLPLVLAPDRLLFLLLLAGAALSWGRHWRWGRRLVSVVAVSMALLSTVQVGPWLVQLLENRFPPQTAAPARVDGIIVLGGFVDLGLTRERGQPQLYSTIERLTEFVRLARLHPEAKLVFTGGAGSLLDQGSSEADVARQLMIDLGFPVERVLFESKSRNTFENATLSLPLAQPQPGETWLLVTSASHMPRAVGVFRQQGWPVVPWPVDYVTRPDLGLVPDLSLSGPFGRMYFAFHEWAGLVWYRLTGKTGQLFPAPTA